MGLSDHVGDRVAASAAFRAQEACRVDLQRVFEEHGVQRVFDAIPVVFQDLTPEERALLVRRTNDLQATFAWRSGDDPA